MNKEFDAIEIEEMKSDSEFIEDFKSFLSSQEYTFEDIARALAVFYLYCEYQK